jgi:hypothetical protein
MITLYNAHVAAGASQVQIRTIPAGGAGFAANARLGVLRGQDAVDAVLSTGYPGKLAVAVRPRNAVAVVVKGADDTHDAVVFAKAWDWDPTVAHVALKWVAPKRLSTTLRQRSRVASTFLAALYEAGYRYAITGGGDATLLQARGWVSLRDALVAAGVDVPATGQVERRIHSALDCDVRGSTVEQLWWSQSIPEVSVPSSPQALTEALAAVSHGLELQQLVGSLKTTLSSDVSIATLLVYEDQVVTPMLQRDENAGEVSEPLSQRLAFNLSTLYAHLSDRSAA